MRALAFRILLLTAIAAWFGVVAPLHPRGIIKLPGARCDATTVSCCHTGKSAGGGSKHKPVDPDCAICHFLATMELPGDVGMDVPPLGFAEEIAVGAPQRVHVVECDLSIFERGPPLA